MAYDSLADFLESLSSCGELTRVAAEVDPHLEIAEVTRRVAAASGPALLFDRLRGSSLALVTNLLGTPRRACLALDVESLDDIPHRIERLVREHTPQNWFERLKMSADAAGIDKFLPEPVKAAACQQVVRLGRDIDLAVLPLLRQWPGEQASSLAGGRLLTRPLAGQSTSATFAPIVFLDHNTLAVDGDARSGFARNWQAHRAARQKMPAAIVLGGDPAGAIAAALEVLGDVDALLLAGLVRAKPLEAIKCRSHDLLVPADADLVIEGYFDPETPPAALELAAHVTQLERKSCPVLQVTAITQRSRAIIPTIISSGGGETSVLAKARERVLLEALRPIVPDLVDLALPVLGGARSFAFVALRKRYPYHARQVASALWGTAALAATRFLVLVDADVDVHDPTRVLAEIGARALPRRDIFTHDGPDQELASATVTEAPRHLAIDATAKIAGETNAASGPRLASDAEIEALVTARWAEYQIEAPAAREHAPAAVVN